MALINNKHGFDASEEYFKKQYGEGFQEFIDRHGEDKIDIDITNKVVVALEEDFSGDNIPVNILGAFVSECETKHYTARLIYVGHISFIKLQWKSGNVAYFYKDDECVPQDFKDWWAEGLQAGYEAKEKGFTADDVINQVECLIRAEHDFRFKLKAEDLIVLEGL